MEWAPKGHSIQLAWIPAISIQEKTEMVLLFFSFGIPRDSPQSECEMRDGSDKKKEGFSSLSFTQFPYPGKREREGKKEQCQSQDPPPRSQCNVPLPSSNSISGSRSSHNASQSLYLYFLSLFCAMSDDVLSLVSSTSSFFFLLLPFLRERKK